MLTVECLGLQVTAAVVTCGGLCPGLNDVVQNIVCSLSSLAAFPSFYGITPQRRSPCLSHCHTQGVRVTLTQFLTPFARRYSMQGSECIQ